MKKNGLVFAAIVGLMSAFVQFVCAADMGENYSKLQGHGQLEGQIIRECIIDGYKLDYHLFDMRARVANMKPIPGTEKATITHHLMVYVKGRDGNNIRKARVKYYVKGLDGKEQKIYAMLMGDGFGADIDLGAGFAYNFRTEISIGKKKLADAFSHEVK